MDDASDRHANPELIAIGVIARDSARASTWRDRTLTQQHRVGEKTFIDFSGKRPHVVDPKTGEE